MKTLKQILNETTEDDVDPTAHHAKALLQKHGLTQESIESLHEPYEDNYGGPRYDSTEPNIRHHQAHRTNPEDALATEMARDDASGHKLSRTGDRPIHRFLRAAASSANRVKGDLQVHYRIPANSITNAREKRYRESERDIVNAHRDGVKPGFGETGERRMPIYARDMNGYIGEKHMSAHIPYEIHDFDYPIGQDREDPSMHHVQRIVTVVHTPKGHKGSMQIGDNTYIHAGEPIMHVHKVESTHHEEYSDTQEHPETGMPLGKKVTTHYIHVQPLSSIMSYPPRKHK